MDWSNNGITLWPCMRLAGEQASRGKSRDYREMQAISYLHYLLLARPDLHVTQGLLTCEDNITFFFGIAGYGIRSFAVNWASKELWKLLYAFVYRLYEPGDFADPSYVKMVPNWEKNIGTYTVCITEKTEDGVETAIECPGFEHIYASSPFETRTHVLSNPHSQVTVNTKILTVFKDQLCRLGTAFDEYTILNLIHTPEKVPGVVEAVYHEFIMIPSFIPASKKRGRRRIGLGQTGRPFPSIPTLQQMLGVVFDILEGTLISIDLSPPPQMFAVLRYLRSEREILHRDISKGNVLYNEDETPSIGSVCMSDADPSGANEAKEVSPCFIKYLVGERYVRNTL